MASEDLRGSDGSLANTQHFHSNRRENDIDVVERSRTDFEQKITLKRND